MFEKVDTIFIQVSNLERARHFYANQIGLPEIFLEDEFIGFSIGDTTLVLEENHSNQFNQSKISVVVEDLEAAYEELIERGVNLFFDTDEINSQSVIRFEDPDANQWLLVQE